MSLQSTVNNVGMNYNDRFAYFLETPDAEQVGLVFYMSFSDYKLFWQILAVRVGLIYHVFFFFF